MHRIYLRKSIHYGYGSRKDDAECRRAAAHLHAVYTQGDEYHLGICSHKLDILGNARKMSEVYRRIALGVCSAFRTASDYTAFIISGILPIDVLADKMVNIQYLSIEF